MTRRIQIPVRAWLPLLACLACTNANLFEPEIPPEPLPEVKPNEIRGNFCVEDPATIAFPLKVWFVIDDSGSMQTNDPNQRRYEAVKEVATALAEPGRRFFGGETFAGEGATRFSNPRFTDDVNAFNTMVDGVTNPGNGGTPYLSALNLTHSELLQDIQDNAGTARRTRYVIIFLSDGQPTQGTDAEILAATQEIMSLNLQAGGVTLNTVYLGGGNQAAEQILREMANVGKGEYKSFPGGDELDYTGFDFSPIRRNFIHRKFFFTNRSVLPTPEGPQVDSDGDGISDARELEMGTDPTRRDTDGDGCSDLMEERSGWNPRVKGNGECTCEMGPTVDTDGDGLTDCEESWIGTLSTDPDSDIGKENTLAGDLIPDELDYIYLNNATFPNAEDDRDLDGYSDLVEFETHTDVEFNDSSMRERIAYRYSEFRQQADNPRCYEFRIENVTLLPTLATADHARNENVFEFYMAQSAQDDPHGERLFRRARILVPYVESGLNLKVQASQFDTVLSAKPAN